MTVPRSTQIIAAYNALLAQITTALPTLANVQAIYDGPQAELPTNMDLVFVGCDDPLAAATVLSVDGGKQDWLDLGAMTKQESLAIYCSYVAWTGDASLPDCRARAIANIALIETAIRPNPTGGPDAPDGQLGTNSAPGPLAPTGWCDLSVTRMQVVSVASGPALHIQFVIECWTRI